GVPMSLVLMKPEIDCWNPGEHTGTFRGNQMAFIAAKAALEIMLGDNMESETRRKGCIVEKFLNEEILPLGDLKVRGAGLFWGIDTIKYPGAATKITQECFKHNLIIEHAGRNGAVTKIMPPLVISDEDLVRGLEIVRDAVKASIG
ncbi:MAG: aminotransferase class III-fold pyridoxal phosphate-dependent enzyme, partial [Oscillospiraceae bacterium]|nr:aminotransferase class III-fold pyridoxal phosphate-dependent enzyme [Oscillospiraceae bacterium]